MNNIKNIFWDFDGVIIDSMSIRDLGFRKIFEKYDSFQVDELIKYHRLNGGLSRFHKIKYFYNNILKMAVSEADINEYAKKFSNIMKKELIKEKYLISQTIKFIKENYKNYNFHIVSGSEHFELNYLCQNLNLEKYFLTIQGSPTPKKDLVLELITKFNYDINETILIGDSINDYEASELNNITFFGFNNTKLLEITKNYITNFEKF